MKTSIGRWMLASWLLALTACDGSVEAGEATAGATDVGADVADVGRVADATDDATDDAAGDDAATRAAAART